MTVRMPSASISALLSVWISSLRPGQPHCLWGQQPGCQAQPGWCLMPHMSLWGVFLCSFLFSALCSSLEMLPRELNCWKLASRVNCLLHLWEIWVFLENNILYHLLHYRPNPVLHLLIFTSWVGCYLICTGPFPKLVSPFPHLSSHLSQISVWVTQSLNRSWLNERVVENGSSIKSLKKNFYYTPMI